MLTALIVENFKGVGERVEIELRPVTLLFGPNNAGKSTVLHALHYLYELIVNGHADVDRTTLGGETVDLGGFRSLVHAHEDRRIVRVGARLDLSQIALPFDELVDEPLDLFAVDLDDEVDSVWIVLEVTQGRISQCSVGANDPDQAVAVFQAGPSGQPPTLSINGAHPIFSGGDDEDSERPIDRVFCGDDQPELPFGGGPQLRESESGWVVQLPPSVSVIPSARDQLFALLSADWLRENAASAAALHRLIVGSVEALREYLARTIYVGPLRAVPSRSFAPRQSPQPGRWAEGHAAWDSLHRGRNLVPVNEWAKRLGLDLQVDLRHTIEVGGGYEAIEELATHAVELGEQYTWPNEEYPDADTEEALMAWEEAWETTIPVHVTFGMLKEVRAAVQTLKGAYRGTVLRFERPTSGAILSPPDLGVGVSQVIPVVAACCVGESRPADPTHRPPSAVLIEQPELHVHPAVQVGLGDLLLTATRDRQLIIETHSEHLVLRLLRRVRETSEGELPPNAPPAAPEDIAIQYVEPRSGGLHCRLLPVTADGEFSVAWPNGFFDERFEELY